MVLFSCRFSSVGRAPVSKTGCRRFEPCKRHHRSVKAVRALLDVDALKGSKDRTTDIAQALEAAAKANPWAFGDAQPGGYPDVRDGGEGGKTPTGSAREQFAAWAAKALN